MKFFISVLDALVTVLAIAVVISLLSIGVGSSGNMSGSAISSTR